jgi:hypothetical protein
MENGGEKHTNQGKKEKDAVDKGPSITYWHTPGFTKVGAEPNSRSGLNESCILRRDKTLYPPHRSGSTSNCTRESCACECDKLTLKERMSGYDHSNTEY